MKLTKNVWVVWLVATLLSLGGYEIWTLSNSVPNDTLSEAVWDWSSKYPYIPMFVGLGSGLLLGHFFWRKNE